LTQLTADAANEEEGYVMFISDRAHAGGTFHSSHPPGGEVHLAVIL
jgi:hypothetical protein